MVRQVPTILVQLITDKDPVKAKKVTEAMFKMVKLGVEGLKRAYNA